ncbi:ygeA domain protein [Escherichia coli 2-005-03_S4_C1]|nr:ygeA domain protein [Escherichia coli 2-005-03_S4_C1]
MTGWELRIWRKSMLWSREKAAREFGVTQRTWHAWENAEQVDVTVWRTTQALSVRDLLPHMQGMRKADIIRRLENELGETAGMCERDSQPGRMPGYCSSGNSFFSSSPESPVTS